MKKRNFTLIEILGVTALIVILLLIGIGAYTYAMDSAREKSTRATITRLENAFKMIQDKGLMQVTTGSAYVKIKFDSGNKKVSLGSKDISGEAYKLFVKAMDADSIDSILDSDNFICDGWEQPLYLRFPGKFNRGGFDIISAGSDGTFGTDNAAEPATEIGKYKDSAGERICDDIANFL